MPVTNARYALNAANARWGSLYDALYGTDAIPEDGGAARGRGYNTVRGARGGRQGARRFWTRPRRSPCGSHRDATRYAIDDGRLTITLKDHAQDRTGAAGAVRRLSRRRRRPVGRAAEAQRAAHRDRASIATRPIGRQDAAGVADVVLEAAITTIQDCEDSVACVDADDKVAAYRNWLGLMQGTLTETFDKDGRTITRRLNADRDYTTPDGGTLHLAGPQPDAGAQRRPSHVHRCGARCDGRRDAGRPAGCRGHVADRDARPERQGPLRNSRTGSVYIVKPKMHGAGGGGVHRHDCSRASRTCWACRATR